MFSETKSRETGKNLYSLLIALFLASVIYPQGGWFWQNPLPAGNTLRDVCFVDENNGIAIGEAGTIIRTTDGGENWTVQPSGTMIKLNGVNFTDENNGWIVGGDSYTQYIVNSLTGYIEYPVIDSSIILHTTDGGLTWIRQNCSSTIPLNDVCFLDENIGIAVGGGDNMDGIILRTTDGGENWIIQFIDSGASYYFFNAVSLIDTNSAVVAGMNGRIFRTTNGGKNWISQELSYGPFYGVSFTTANIGIVVGSHWNDLTQEIRIFRTTNAGYSWDRQSVEVNGVLYGVCFSDTNHGTAVGQEWSTGSGLVLHTTDGGKNWAKQAVGQTNYFSLYGVSFFSKDIGIIVGHAGRILKTTDGGINWFSQQKGINKDLNKVCFIDKNYGWAIGWNSILRTSDGGTSWVNQTVDSTIGLGSVCFTDANNGTVVGTDWETNLGVILRTTDGGNNWNYQPISTNAYLTDVYFIDANTGTIVGEEQKNIYPNAGVIFRTTNGGNDWFRQPCDSTITLSAVHFIDANKGMAVGGRWNNDINDYEGVILSTTNGGTNWIRRTIKTNSVLHDVYMSNLNTATVVGGGPCAGQGIILRTTDGGEIWNTNYVFEDFMAGPYGVAFTDANNGTVVGVGANLGGLILKTTDGGETWISQNSSTSNWLNSVCLVDPLNGWTVGANGTILHTTNGGVTFVEEDQVRNNLSPKDYLLYQNYPNPFNPSTKISWQSPVSSRQTLKIYDVLGNEIVTLVDEEMEAGYHSVDFDASQLPSGVYFYQLKAGNFLETKKMILLR
jgi:photosystem II stability/assembly factor-like uncharacterized protein